MISKIINFIKTDIWRIRLKTLPRAKYLLLKPVMIIILALRSFDEDKCQLRASALTYYSLLSIVPVVAMAFGIAKGFGFETVLEKVLLEKLPGQQEVITQVITFAQTLLENTKGGIIAGIGVAVLFWTVIKVLGNIEKSFNDIWGIKQPRSMGRKFSDYLSIMLICPLLFIMSSSLTVFISTQVQVVIDKIALLGMFSPLIMFLLKLLPYCALWVLFTFIYIFMPNTKVDFKSGLLAGIAAGTLYQVVQLAYINFQFGVAKYNAIYGSFAALPLFLVWLQMSWLIVLLGAEISFARQNLETYEFEPDCLKASYSFKKKLTLQIMQVLARNFHKGEKPQTASELSHELEIPIRLIRQLLYDLIEAGLVSEIKESAKTGIAYQPARCTQALTIKDVIDILEHHGTENIPVTKSKALDKISASLDTFSETIDKSKANLLIEEI
ncbi:MAG: YihY family inner membrane protein [PVC group bacterium]|nr:YihY family inner membrane protein [PVC group bacterium]